MLKPLKYLKKPLCLFTAVCCLPTTLLAQTTYHLGNSLTDTNNGMLSPITQSAGKSHTYLRTTIPGAPTDWIWDHPGQANGEPDYRTVFANRVLDHLFTQPFAGHCRSIDNEADYSGRFFTQARNKNANVQHWLYMQWPSTALDDCWSKGQGGVNGTAATNFIQAICNFRIYFEKVRELMDAQQPGKAIRIMPSGLALAKLKIEMEAGRVLGMTDFNATVFSDGLHLTDKGAYLVSLTHYVGIYGESPVNRVTYKPASLTDQQANIFKQIAWNVVSDYPWAGLGGSGTLANEICNSSGGTPPPPPPPITTTGNVEREYWANVGGTAVSMIPVNTAPTSKNLITSLEGPTNVAENYGTRIRGYIVPSTEGWYNLYIAGDDNAELWFSSGTNPADKARIAHVPGWTNAREWGKYPEQKSNQVYLVKGGKFYFEVLHKEGGGGDNLAVAWTGPGITTPTVIAGANLDRYTTSTTPSGTTYLSDLNWSSATNGHGPVEKDKSNGEAAAGDGRTLTLNGVTYAKGLGTHAASEIIYNLNGAYSTFLSDIGIDDEVVAGTCGSAVFEVYVDGTLAYTSGTMNPSTATKNINLNVAGKNQLKLVVTTAGDNNFCDHADWANARLTTGSGARVAITDEVDVTDAVTVYPNPAKGQLNVAYRVNADQVVDLSLLNHLSQRVGSYSQRATKGQNTAKLDVTAHHEGMYFLVVSKDGRQVVKKVLIRP